MEIVGLATLSAIVWKAVDFLKFVSNKDWKAVATQASVWVSAVVVALLAREAEPFSEIVIFGSTFGDLSWAAIVLMALGLGSTASGLYDFKRAIDNTDGAHVPSLLPETTATYPDEPLG